MFEHIYRVTQRRRQHALADARALRGVPLGEVPEGYALLTFQDGELTSVAADPGAYIWDSEELDSQSIYAEGGWVSALLGHANTRITEQYYARHTDERLQELHDQFSPDPEAAPQRPNNQTNPNQR